MFSALTAVAALFTAQYVVIVKGPTPSHTETVLQRQTKQQTPGNARKKAIAKRPRITWMMLLGFLFICIEKPLTCFFKYFTWTIWWRCVFLYFYLLVLVNTGGSVTDRFVQVRSTKVSVETANPFSGIAAKPKLKHNLPPSCPTVMSGMKSNRLTKTRPESVKRPSLQEGTERSNPRPVRSRFRSILMEQNSRS